MTRQGTTNDRLGVRELRLNCAVDATGRSLLHAAAVRFGWSMRSYHRVLRVARTIADLAGVADISSQHVAEAIQFRRALREK